MKKLEKMKSNELITEINKLKERIKELETTDIKLKKVEKDLTESENRFKSILNNTNAVIYVKDINGKYLFVNKRYEELFHVSLNEVKGKTDYDFHTMEFADKFTENDKKVLEFESSIEFEEEACHDDGVHNYISLKFPLFNNTGNIYSVCGISTDITLRKCAEFEKEKVIAELKAALTKVKQLSGLIPMCSVCRRMRDDHGYWRAVDKYIEEHSNIKFTEGMCPECYSHYHEEDSED
jgi:PAS domain S-box-containing protein